MKTKTIIFALILTCLTTFTLTKTALSSDAPPQVQVKLPQDELPHASVPIEWWYYSGHLQDAQGRRYGIMASFFMFGAGNMAKQHFVIFQLAEKDAKKFHTASVIEKSLIDTTRMIVNALPDDLKSKLPKNLLDKDEIEKYNTYIQGKPVVLKDRLGLKYGDNTFEKTGAGDDWHNWTYKTTLAGDGFAADLEMKPMRGPMYVGGTGNVGMLQGQDMFYYSFSRLDSKGTITIHGEKREVSGILWYDHQFGAMGKNNEPVGWDWFCVQLEDGTDLNISALRHVETDERFNRMATIQGPGGASEVVRDLVIEPLGQWTSPTTGIKYPSGWLLAIPSRGMQFEIHPDFPEQEMRTFGPMRAIWEGTCTVDATVNGKAVKGNGYTELVGYNYPK